MRYEIESVDDPRLGKISTRIRDLMENDYRNAEIEDEREHVLETVRDQLEQYYFETSLDKY